MELRLNLTKSLINGLLFSSCRLLPRNTRDACLRRKKGLFCLMGFDILVHAPRCSFVCDWEQTHFGGNGITWQRYSPHGWGLTERDPQVQKSYFYL